jgi:hypothetical protein
MCLQTRPSDLLTRSCVCKHARSTFAHTRLCKSVGNCTTGARKWQGAILSLLSPPPQKCVVGVGVKCVIGTVGYRKCIWSGCWCKKFLSQHPLHITYRITHYSTAAPAPAAAPDMALAARTAGNTAHTHYKGADKMWMLSWERMMGSVRNGMRSLHNIPTVGRMQHRAHSCTGRPQLYNRCCLHIKIRPCIAGTPPLSRTECTVMHTGRCTIHQCKHNIISLQYTTARCADTRYHDGIMM